VTENTRRCLQKRGLDGAFRLQRACVNLRVIASQASCHAARDSPKIAAVSEDRPQFLAPPPPCPGFPRTRSLSLVAIPEIPRHLGKRPGRYPFSPRIRILGRHPCRFSSWASDPGCIQLLSPRPRGRGARWAARFGAAAHRRRRWPREVTIRMIPAATNAPPTTTPMESSSM
jgi:hypothetical protein